MAIRHLVTILAVSVLAGCVSERTDEEAAATTPQVAEQQSETAVQARVPIDGYMEVDEEWLESGRLDTSWRSAAERDRQARLRAASGAQRSEAQGSQAQGSQAQGSQAQRSQAQRRSDAGTTASGADAPVERMRARVAQEGGAAESSSPSDGASNAGSAGAESWDSLSSQVFADFSPTLPVPQEGGGPTVLALQWMLDRVSFSPGVIDGRWGKNTEKAVYWLQDSVGLEATGRADRRLWDLLSAQVGADGPLRQHTVAAGDVEGPFVDIPEDPQEQADLDCLCYSSASEALAERFHTTPDLLAQLNPGVDLDSISAGASLWVPAVEQVEPEGGMDDVVEKIVINRDGFYLHALDGDGKVLYHFPVTVGSSYDASPEGELEVTGIAFRPDYHFQPTELSSVPDDEEEAILPPGPNSPVGLVWMQLSKDTYGIHGTSAPSTIGYATSHGCVRLTNWDAIFLANRTGRGAPVSFTGG